MSFRFRRRVRLLPLLSTLLATACSTMPIAPQWERVTTTDKALGTTETFVTLNNAPVSISLGDFGNWSVIRFPKRIRQNFSDTNYGCTFTIRAEGEEPQYIGSRCTDDGAASPIGYPGSPDIGLPRAGTTPGEFTRILIDLAGKKVYFGYTSNDGKEVVEMTLPAAPEIRGFQ